MRFFSHYFFHNETNDRGEKGMVHVPTDRSLWPAAWTKIDYKQYSLFPSIRLPQQRSFFFDEILAKRWSSTGSVDGNVITQDALSYIFQCGYGLQGSQKSGRQENRTVPSAGKRYPLEIYSFLFQTIETLHPGVYHYAVKEHSLEPVLKTSFSRETIDSFSSMEWLSGANGMIVLTGVFSRVAMKYGSRGYRYILLEAGHVAQNMLLAGTEKQINMIPLGGVNEEVIEEYMGLNTLDERVVYVLSF